MPVSADRRAQLAGVPANQRANAGEFDPEGCCGRTGFIRLTGLTCNAAGVSEVSDMYQTLADAGSWTSRLRTGLAI